MLPYLHSLIAIPLIYLYTMVMATISLTLSLHDPTGIRQHWCAQTWCKLIAWTVGMKVIIHGRENLDLSRPAVYMSNHQSYMDIPTLFAFLPFQFRIFAKKVLFYIPFMGWHLWRAGNIPVDRGNHSATSKVLNLGVEKLRSGVPIVVFPEGTRGTELRRVKRFKAGAFKIAQMAKVPVVPITIVGTAHILQKDSLLFRPGTVHLFIDPPIETADTDDQRLSDVVTQVQQVMNTNLERVYGQSSAGTAGSVPVSILR